MRREVSIEEISDGKIYGINDMVRADCQDCEGCSDCCRGMGKSIILDPLDIHRLKNGLGMSFNDLMLEAIELNIVDAVILPNLRMKGQEEACHFLDENGRCAIHVHRPGICRLFPLGRIYEEKNFQYFLQVHECRKSNRSKIKVSKWIDTDRVKENQIFIKTWHNFLKDLELYIVESQEEEVVRQVGMYVLHHFYMPDYEEAKFYDSMKIKIAEAYENLGL